MTKIRIFHVEDYQIMLDVVKVLLEQDPDLILVGQASHGIDLLEALLRVQADVLILDIYLDKMQDLKVSDGFEICAAVKERYPDITTIIHSAYDDAGHIARVMGSGVNGFVSKKSGVAELIKAVKATANGHRCSGQDAS